MFGGATGGAKISYVGAIAPPCPPIVTPLFEPPTDVPV